MNCHAMPSVVKCEVDKCFYNNGMQCHVPAINVGGKTHPRCDTFMPLDNHIGCTGSSGVGACHTSLCQHNNELTCNASEIIVGYHGDHADCNTFAPR